MNNNVSRRDQLAAQMMVCTHTVKELLTKIGDLENNTQLSNDEKFEQIKNIRLEISEVSTEIDNLKREIKMLATYTIN